MPRRDGQHAPASQIVMSEDEIALAEHGMRDGLKAQQTEELDAYLLRERIERDARQRERQARYDREHR